MVINNCSGIKMEFNHNIAINEAAPEGVHNDLNTGVPSTEEINSQNTSGLHVGTTRTGNQITENSEGHPEDNDDISRKNRIFCLQKLYSTNQGRTN
ncbi:hypothetical protein ZOSMA_413G00030 [Zostera marina]|uniref:Uncharacterized protein n=1 Tax=Zostera marina TaxID=29655 RepID=A0A0K9P2Z8_ZOSMR|nr:hypothetical protein ZOSMA_413G00030 [Zostera marina]